MTGLAALLAFGFVLFWASVVGYTVYLLTHPPRRTYASALARGKPGEPSELPRPRAFTRWTFTSGGVEFPVWEVRGDAPSGATIVLTHGWGDSRIGALARLDALAPFASRIVAWDMRGHGEAAARCTLGVREVEDLVALVTVLEVREADRGPEGRSAPSPSREGSGTLVLYGWSLGAGVSIVAAARMLLAGGPVPAPRIAAVIAESPYRQPWTPARNVLRLRALPWRVNIPVAFALVGLGMGVGTRWARRGGFDRARWAARLPVPLMVLHGAHDEICPAEDGRDIAGAAPKSELALIGGGSHNDLWTDPELAAVCTDHVGRFLGGVLRGAGAREARGGGAGLDEAVVDGVRAEPSADRGGS